MIRPDLRRYAWLSIGAALLTIALKTLAWWQTGSVGLLSDAMESVVNLVSAMMAFWMLTVAARPADDDHAFGHGKAEYFSSGFEGFMIMAAACAIVFAALGRLLNPQPVAALGIGVALSVLASLVNLVVGWILLRAAGQFRSITLEADAHHLYSDVWTTAGVLVGLGAAWLTGWWWLDPVIALLVGVKIVRTGIALVGRSAAGLMDEALPAGEQQCIASILDKWAATGIAFHAVRTRLAGARSFLQMHVLVPGDWTVQRGHDLLELIEGDLHQALPHLRVHTHLEPLEDPRSFADAALDREPV